MISSLQEMAGNSACPGTVASRGMAHVEHCARPIAGTLATFNIRTDYPRGVNRTVAWTGSVFLVKEVITAGVWHVSLVVVD